MKKSTIIYILLLFCSFHTKEEDLQCIFQNVFYFPSSFLFFPPPFITAAHGQVYPFDEDSSSAIPLRSDPEGWLYYDPSDIPPYVPPRDLYNNPNTLHHDPPNVESGMGRSDAIFPEVYASSSADSPVAGSSRMGSFHDDSNIRKRPYLSRENPRSNQQTRYSGSVDPANQPSTSRMAPPPTKIHKIDYPQQSDIPGNSENSDEEEVLGSAPGNAQNAEEPIACALLKKSNIRGIVLEGIGILFLLGTKSSEQVNIAEQDYMEQLILSMINIFNEIKKCEFIRAIVILFNHNEGQSFLNGVKTDLRNEMEKRITEDDYQDFINFYKKISFVNIFKVVSGSVSERSFDRHMRRLIVNPKHKESGNPEHKESGNPEHKESGKILVVYMDDKYLADPIFMLPDLYKWKFYTGEFPVSLISVLEGEKNKRR